MPSVGYTEMDNMQATISLKGLKVYFQSKKGFFSKPKIVKAVDGVDIDIKPGETLALVGESGSGKTTIGRASLRLIKPTSGEIFFQGIGIGNLREKELKWFRRKSQMIFQDPYSSLNQFMNVFQIVEEPLIIHRERDMEKRKDAVYKILEDVRLPPEEFALKYPHMLSGGQRQRVGIARALILNPEYVVADEPVSMIDASSRTEVLLLLRELQKKYGIAFLYITHDIATAKYFSDRIAVIYKGKIVEIGSSKKVIMSPEHPYTKALIESIPEPNPDNRFRERKVEFSGY